MRRFAVRFLAVLMSVTVVVIGGGVIWAWDAYRAAGPLDKAVTIIIPKGAGVQDIADQLASASRRCEHRLA